MLNIPIFNEIKAVQKYKKKVANLTLYLLHKTLNFVLTCVAGRRKKGSFLYYIHNELIKQKYSTVSVACSSANIKENIMYINMYRPIPFGIPFKYSILYEQFRTYNPHNNPRTAKCIGICNI